MNTIFELINPDNTLSVNRRPAHSIGLAEAVVYVSRKRAGISAACGHICALRCSLRRWSFHRSRGRRQRCCFLREGVIPPHKKGLPSALDFFGIVCYNQSERKEKGGDTDGRDNIRRDRLRKQG